MPYNYKGAVLKEVLTAL